MSCGHYYILGRDALDSVYASQAAQQTLGLKDTNDPSYYREGHDSNLCSHVAVKAVVRLAQVYSPN